MNQQNTHKFSLFAFFLLTTLFVSAQELPIIVEVEDGLVGADFSTQTEADLTYLSIGTNGTAGHPENDDRVVSMEITFPAAQTYDLYVRVRIGAGAANDDSFFYAAGFGPKAYTDAGWVRVNNIHSNGYLLANEVVDGNGGAGQGVWKWLNLSEFTGDEPPLTFEVTTDSLTRMFQIGAREDGLDIDKIAFARADYYFTVANLDLVQAGSDTPGGPGPTMSPIAEGKEKFLGNVYSSSQAVGFANYWNQVTPENAGKWGSVEASRDNMNWTGLDAAYALAKDNNFPFKLHVLIWGNQQPAWIENLSPAEQLEEIKEWMQELAGRYPAIDFVEVVNEPLHDPPNSAGNGGGNYINALGGAGSTGWDWILEAFRLAREYFPNAELMLNDYSIVNSATSTTDYLEIISLLQAAGLIDQIGVQAHAFSTRGTSANTIKGNLDRLAATGLPIYATELDIDGATDQIQLEEYQRIFPVFWEHPSVRGITLWGFRPGMWRTQQMAYLIGQDGGTERPALIWLRGYVESTLVGVRERSAAAGHIRVYPNPYTAGDLYIEGLDELRSLVLFDLRGRRIWAGHPTQNTVHLPEGLPSGLYVLKLFDGKQVFAKKIMIK